MSDEVTIGRRFTLVIPKAVRRRAGLREGQRALVRTEDGRIILEALPLDPYGALAETLGDIGYSEAKHEGKAIEWLMKNARTRHAGAVRA